MSVRTYTEKKQEERSNTMAIWTFTTPNMCDILGLLCFHGKVLLVHTKTKLLCVSVKQYIIYRETELAKYRTYTVE